MQWIQKGFSESLGDAVSIFTHAMTHHYNTPEAFRYDERNFGTEPVVTDPNLDSFNADSKMSKLRFYLLKDSLSFKTPRLLIPWGDDFWFSNAHLTYHNLENTINYFNEKYDDITLLYSTPSEFVDALKEYTDVEWPVRYDDMLPFADQNADYWTGYFTSRSNAKKLTRQTSQNFHASNKVFGLKVLDETVEDAEVEAYMDSQYRMLDALGIMQHHDAITGTAKQAVADYYNYLMETAMDYSNYYYSHIVGKIATGLGVSSDLERDWTNCSISQIESADCGITDSKGQTWGLVVQNPATVD